MEKADRRKLQQLANKKIKTKTGSRPIKVIQGKYCHIDDI